MLNGQCHNLIPGMATTSQHVQKIMSFEILAAVSSIIGQESFRARPPQRHCNPFAQVIRYNLNPNSIPACMPPNLHNTRSVCLCRMLSNAKIFCLCHAQVFDALNY